MRRRAARAVVAPLALAMAVLAGCTAPSDETPEHEGPREVGVQMFQWTWDSIAAECTNTLGPDGYAWVMTSPPQEHVLGEAWWTAYQPVSYQVESRLGTREEFAAMVTACNEAGMEVYADAVVNHMTGIDDAAPPATGWAGSTYTHYDYPGRYATEDLHRCGLTPDDDIADYRNSLQVRTCELVNLADLRTEEPAVRATITAYLQDLVSLGVRGLRIDAAKHMVPEDIAAILEPLPDDVEIIQEIIRGAGEPIVPEQYTGNGEVYEFAWGRDIIGMLQGGSLRAFADLGAGSGYLRSEFARVFVDNHDTERNASTLSYTGGASYVLANVLLLAGAYGTPVVYSGYAFSERDAGPPQDDSGAVLDATCATPSGPGSSYDDGDRVCQRDWPPIAGMVGFHNATVDTPVTNWWDDSRTIAFGRGEAGFVVVNKDDEPLKGTWTTSLPTGTYCDVFAGPMVDRECAGESVEVADDGTFTTTVGAEAAVALHVGAVLAD